MLQATWGRRCNVLLFVTEKDDVGALSIMKVDVATGREHLTAKTMSAFDHVYEHHRQDADWFLKVSASRRSYICCRASVKLLPSVAGFSQSPCPPSGTACRTT